MMIPAWLALLLRAWDRIQCRLEALWATFLVRRGASPLSFEPRRIVILRPDELGDAVLGLPFLRGVRQRYPQARILLAAKGSVLPLYASCPWIDETMALDLPARRLFRWPRAFFQGRRAGIALRAWHPDTVFCPRFGTDWHGAAWAAFFSMARRREGFAGDGEGLSPSRAKLQTVSWNDSETRSEVARSGDGLRALELKKVDLRLDLFFSAAEKQEARAWLKARGLRQGQKIIAFGVGAGNPRRCWPLERFILVAKTLPQYKILVPGGPAELKMGQILARALGSRILDACGLPLRQGAALLGASALYIGADSGAMHLAAAQGIPVVELSAHPRSASPFHFNAPERFGPWDVPAVILRPDRPVPPCQGACLQRQPHCILAISAQDVLHAAHQLLRISTKKRMIKGPKR